MNDQKKVQTRMHCLTWSHYRCLRLVSNEKARQQKEIYRLQQAKLEGDAL